VVTYIYPVIPTFKYVSDPEYTSVFNLTVGFCVSQCIQLNSALNISHLICQNWKQLGHSRMLTILSVGLSTL
jgi:hypothetical protein